jgi:hypothetical protein
MRGHASVMLVMLQWNLGLCFLFLILHLVIQRGLGFSPCFL